MYKQKLQKIGQKITNYYDLSNHLGNVQVVVSDKRKGQDDGTGKAGFYLADVVKATDFYAFGSEMPGRTYNQSGSEYRFGFNGKEQDIEGMGGGGATYDYGFRIYNPQLAKFLSVDPLSSEFPWYTPYQFAGNKPTWAIDLDGLEEHIFHFRIDDLKKGEVTLIKKEYNLSIDFESKTVTNLALGTTTGIYNSTDWGKVQYKYEDKDGNELTVRRNENGEFVAGENELIYEFGSNIFGSTYIGPWNPENNGKSDYRREPQDAADAAAIRHDKDYGLVGGKGVKGAFLETKTLEADIALVQRSNKVVEMYNNCEIDPYTNKPVSKKTYGRANKIALLFTEIVLNKIKGTAINRANEIKVELTQTKKIDNTASDLEHDYSKGPVK